MDSGAVSERRVLAISVGLCFLFSGSAGLVYEIVWMRMLGLVFGHTAFAITTVLTAFMAGLALGAFIFGRLIDRRGRPLRVYALLEAGIGVYGLLIPTLLAQAEVVYLALYRSLGLSVFTFSLAQFALAFLILLVPTTLMGASLPVMAKFFVSRLEGLGRKIGYLYALNTFGAVLGSGTAGFFLLPAIGVKATTVLAVAVNLGVGCWALVTDRWTREPREAPTEPRQPEESRALGTSGSELLPLSTPLMMRLVLVGIGLSGAASMVYEIAWTRALRLVIGSSIYAFSAMLTTFLIGLALGSFLFARIWGRRRVDIALFGWFEVAIGLAALVLIPTFERMPDLVLTILGHLSPSARAALVTQFMLSFLVMIVPTTIIGCVFPCAVQICSRALPRLGRDIGEVYSANTMGTIGGALFGGFLLVPWLGAQASMMAAAAMNAAIGVVVLVASAASRPLWRRAVVAPVVLVFAAAVVFLPRWDRRVMVGGVSIYVKRFAAEEDPVARFRREGASRQLLFYRDGINSTVAVERTERMTLLKIDGKVDASNGVDMTTQLMLGHLPVFLHPRPERVLVIGLGSGVTAGAVAQHPIVREIDVVELEPAVVEASKFFIRENRGVLHDPRVRLVIGDGRNFILGSGKRYDVISSEPSNPWMAGVANLFSREFYRLAQERLKDDGIMVQWVHGYSLFPRELKMIVNTFRQVFPHSTLWRTIRSDYLLVGGTSPLSVDYALLERRIEASATVREDMASLRLSSPLDLFTLFFLDEGDLARFAEGAVENTDDRPLLEFAAPMALYADTTDENARLLRDARTREFPAVTNLPPGLLEAARVHFARVYWARGEKEEALAQIRKAPPLDPDDIASQIERAKLLFSLGEFTQATAELARLAELRPEDRLIGSYLKAGAILRQLEAKETVTQHGRTRHGDPNPAEAHNNLGVFYTRLGIRFGERAFFDLAVDSLEAARQIEPQAYQVLNNLANAYFELGKLEEAAKGYLRVLELAPHLAEARFNLGLVYEKKGMRELAAREFLAASALRPDWGLPRKRLLQMGSPPAPGAGHPRNGMPPTR